MKFSCEKSILQDAIITASKAVNGKSSIALLEGLKIIAKDNLTICGYDLSMGIRVSIDADISEPGEIVLNAKILGDIIRKQADDVIYIESDEKLMTTIKCGKSVFNIIATSAEDFPQIPTVNAEKCIEIKEKQLKSMISQTIFAVSDNESKPIHTGCLFEVNGQTLNIVAVDGYRLSIRKEILENQIENNISFVVPGSALREIERILSETDNEVRFYPDEKHIMFEIGSTVFVSRLLDGEFLNYNNALPKDCDFEVTIDVHELITAVERVSLIVSEKLKNPVRMTFCRDILQLSCITAIGKSYDECSIDGYIENLEIGFNNRYILDALRACPTEKVKLSLKGSLNPVLFTPVEGDNFTYLVLPVRLKAND